MGEPIRDLHPTMDARFILVEIGKLLNESQAHTKAIDKLVDKVTHLDDTVKSAKLIGRVIAGLVAVLAAVVTWLVSVLWPFREKIFALIAGH